MKVTNKLINIHALSTIRKIGTMHAYVGSTLCCTFIIKRDNYIYVHENRAKREVL